MNIDVYRKPADPNKHFHAEPGAYVIETGRNQHTLLVEAFCPFCEGTSAQAVYYSYDTAIAHECRACHHRIWNNTRYSHTTARHLSTLRVRLAREDDPQVQWAGPSLDAVLEGEQCLLCRAYHRNFIREVGHAPASSRCDRPNTAQKRSA